MPFTSYEENDPNYEPAEATCRYCGEEIDWLYTGVRWRAYCTDKAEPHVCDISGAFDVLPR